MARSCASLVWSAAALLLCAQAPAVAAACTQSRPEKVVADLYLHHGRLTRAAARASLSAPLRSLVEAELRSGARHDWAFWSGERQRAAGERVLVSDTLIEGPQASTLLSYGIATTPGASPDHKLFARLQLVREADGCWRVDDIVRDGASLKAALELAQEQRGR
jgi:hypothetical protein